MKGTYEIIRIGGIPLKIHWSFAFVFPITFWWAKNQGANWIGISTLLLLVIAIFICVILHEFGHAIAAAFLGVRTHEIIILPVGGAALLERLPQKPIQELIIALAGPFVNLLLALFICLTIRFVAPHQYFLLDILDKGILFNGTVSFFWTLCQINLALVLLNLIPAFPLDGGRALRALLCMVSNRKQATSIAAWIGKIFAIIAMFMGLYLGDPVTIVVAGVIFYGASNEYQMIALDDLLTDNNVGMIMDKSFTKLNTTNTIQEAYQILIKNRDIAFLVFREETFIGVIEEDAIVHAMRKKLENDTIDQYCTPVKTYVLSNDSLYVAQNKLSANQITLLPVIENDKIIAIIDTEAIHNFIRIKKRFQN